MKSTREEEVALYSDISARVTEMKHSKEMSEFFKGSDMTMCAPEKLKADPYSVSTIVVEYADFGGKWRELGGKLAARAYLRLADLENELIDVVANKLSDGSLKVGFKDLKELSIAKANASREALTARGEASNISEERVVYTQEDYELAAKAAADRIKTMKRATTEEVTDV